MLNTTVPGATTPSFATKNDFPTGTNPYSVTMGDVNGDGRPDLAVANLASDSVSLLLNTTVPGATTPSFATKNDFPTGTNPGFVAMEDGMGMAKPDLAVANRGSDTVSLLLNTTVSGATNARLCPQERLPYG